MFLSNCKYIKVLITIFCYFYFKLGILGGNYRKEIPSQ